MTYVLAALMLIAFVAWRCGGTLPQCCGLGMGMCPGCPWDEGRQ